MNNEIICIFKLSLESSSFHTFEKLIAQIVNDTDKEVGTLTYLYCVNEEKNSVHIVERYQENSLLSHIDTTFSPFADEFLSLVSITELTVYGYPNDEEKSRLDKFGAQYLIPFNGFSK
jgi:quinol monooxygenase YgiN